MKFDCGVSTSVPVIGMRHSRAPRSEAMKTTSPTMQMPLGEACATGHSALGLTNRESPHVPSHVGQP